MTTYVMNYDSGELGDFAARAVHSAAQLLDSPTPGQLWPRPAELLTGESG